MKTRFKKSPIIAAYLLLVIVVTLPFIHKIKAISDSIWSVSITLEPAPSKGAAEPILALTSSTEPFSTYYAEILRAEGLNSFSSSDISTLSASQLSQHSVVILGD